MRTILHCTIGEKRGGRRRNGPWENIFGCLRSQSGIAYLEFALCLPVLLALLVGGVEVTRYVLICQKVEKTSMTISDLTAQLTTAKTSQLDVILLASKQVMLPYSFGNNGYVIISSVTQGASPASPIVSWQYAGGGTLVKTSRIGTTGHVATLPAGFTLNAGDNIIITEVFYNFTPLLNIPIRYDYLANAGSGQQVIGDVSLYRESVFRPRLGALTTLTIG